MADHRGSIAQDSNPEGINQYSGAGGSKAKAEKASAKATAASAKVRAGTPNFEQKVKDYKAAAKAHGEAAKAHWTASQHAPDSNAIQAHEKRAASHERAQNNLLRGI